VPAAIASIARPRRTRTGGRRSTATNGSGIREAVAASPYRPGEPALPPPGRLQGSSPTPLRRNGSTTTPAGSLNRISSPHRHPRAAWSPAACGLPAVGSACAATPARSRRSPGTRPISPRTTSRRASGSAQSGPAWVEGAAPQKQPAGSYTGRAGGESGRGRCRALLRGL
jgi:hypothetical protein